MPVTALPNAPTPHKHVVKWPEYGIYGALVAGRVWDYQSTERLLSIGGREEELPNALVRNKAAFLSYSLLIPPVEFVATYWARKRGGKWRVAADVIDSLSAASSIATDIHNEGQIHQQERFNGWIK